MTVPREYELEETAREREEGMVMKVSDGERGVIVMIASTVAVRKSFSPSSLPNCFQNSSSIDGFDVCGF